MTLNQKSKKRGGRESERERAKVARKQGNATNDKKEKERSNQYHVEILIQCIQLAL